MLFRIDVSPQTLECILVEGSKLRIEVGDRLDCVVLADTHCEIKKLETNENISTQVPPHGVNENSQLRGLMRVLKARQDERTRCETKKEITVSLYPSNEAWLNSDPHFKFPTFDRGSRSNSKKRIGHSTAVFNSGVGFNQT